MFKIIQKSLDFDPKLESALKITVKGCKVEFIKGNTVIIKNSNLKFLNPHHLIFYNDIKKIPVKYIYDEINSDNRFIINDMEFNNISSLVKKINVLFK